MFVWREVNTVIGFNNEMVNLRNAIVREVNMAFSSYYQKNKDNPQVKKEYEYVCAARNRSLNLVSSKLQRAQIETQLVKECLIPHAEFQSAKLLIKYLKLPLEQVEREVYIELRAPKSMYLRKIKEGDFIFIIPFIDFFPKDDAFNELKYLMALIVDKMDFDSLVPILDMLSQDRYKKLKKDKDVKELLFREYQRAEAEKRVENAKTILPFIEDDELVNRIRVLEALQSGKYQDILDRIVKVKDKEKLWPALIDRYWKEIEFGEKDIEGFTRAIELAIHGGLVEEEHKNYVQHPAGKILEYHLTRPSPTEADYQIAAKYIDYAEKESARMLLATLFMQLIKNNETAKALQLKATFHIDFPAGAYESEVEVRDYFEQLTATHGEFDLPKGEANLITAKDVAKVFDFSEADVRHVNILLCKYYLNKKDFKKAKQYFISHEKELSELMDSLLTDFIDHKDFKAAYRMVDAMQITFDDKTKSIQRKELRGQVRHGFKSPTALARAVILEDIYDLDVIPAERYREIFILGMTNDVKGCQILIDLSIPLSRRADAFGKIKILQTVDFIRVTNDNMANALQEAYDSILPPSFIDYIIYYIRTFLHLY